LERALTAKIRSHESLLEGVKMVEQQLLEILKRHGFEPRDDLGLLFDGRFHNGIAVGSQPKMPDLSIIEVWERGWMRGNEMFRPAKVLVNNLTVDTAPSKKGKEATAEDDMYNDKLEAVPQ
ncbi:MAG TPA: nucleotide exchange factor GrpE, partial [Candidatus Kapabacteria bacterium]|nr:nucleotide exchange factor GrpE [Candidatus Kapabacteria bacterium]